MGTFDQIECAPKLSIIITLMCISALSVGGCATGDRAAFSNREIGAASRVKRIRVHVVSDKRDANDSTTLAILKGAADMLSTAGLSVEKSSTKEVDGTLTIDVERTPVQRWYRDTGTGEDHLLYSDVRIDGRIVFTLPGATITRKFGGYCWGEQILPPFPAGYKKWPGHNFDGALGCSDFFEVLSYIVSSLWGVDRAKMLITLHSLHYSPTRRVYRLWESLIREGVKKTLLVMSDHDPLVLSMLLKHKDRDLRKAGMYWLESYEDLELTESTICNLLQDSREEVRCNIIYSLGKGRHRHATKPLISVLTDNNADVRRAAAQALGSIGDVNALDPLVCRLNDENEAVRIAVLRAFVSMHDTVSLKCLIEALHHERAHVRQEAASVVGWALDWPLVAKKRKEQIAEELRKLTEEDINWDAVKWQEWWKRKQVTKNGD